MSEFFVFFAEAQPAVDGGGGGGPDMMWLFIMFTAAIFLVWIFMMNPQKKQEERMRKMLDSLEKNDRVMTVGGVLGTVHSIDKEQNEIVLKVDEANNTRIRFHLTAVSAVFPKDGGGNK